MTKFEATEKKLFDAQTALSIKSKALNDAVLVHKCEKERILKEIQCLRT
jgi:hypothetical protein